MCLQVYWKEMQREEKLLTYVYENLIVFCK